MQKHLSNYEIGKIGEDAVSLYLERTNHIVLERNYRNRFGEIDIIFVDGNTLVFGEVKTRTSNKFGEPREAVDKRKMNKILAVAKAYISNKRIVNVDIRFDVFEVMYHQRKIKHIKDAYMGCGFH